MSSSGQEPQDQIGPQELEASVNRPTLSSPQPRDSMRSSFQRPPITFLPLTGDDAGLDDENSSNPRSPSVVVRVRNSNLAKRDLGNNPSPLNPPLFHLMDEQLDRRRSDILQLFKTDVASAFQRLLETYDALVVEKRNVEAQYAREWAGQQTLTSPKLHIDSLNRQIQRLKEGKSELKRQKEHVDTERGVLESTNRVFEQKIHFLEAQLKELAHKPDTETTSPKIRLLEDKLRELSGKLEAKQYETEALGKRKDAEIDQLEARLHEAEREIADVATFLAGSSARCEELVSDLLDLKDQNMQQQQEIGRLRARVISDSSKRSGRSSSENIRSSSPRESRTSHTQLTPDPGLPKPAPGVSTNVRKNGSGATTRTTIVEGTPVSQTSNKEEQNGAKQKNSQTNRDDKSKPKVPPKSCTDESHSRERIILWRENVPTVSEPGLTLTEGEAHPAGGSPEHPSPKSRPEPTDTSSRQTLSNTSEQSEASHDSEQTGYIPVYGHSEWFDKAKRLLSPFLSGGKIPSTQSPPVHNEQETGGDSKEAGQSQQNSKGEPKLVDGSLKRSIVRHPKSNPLSLSTKVEQSTSSPDTGRGGSDTEEKINHPQSPTDSPPAIGSSVKSRRPTHTNAKPHIGALMVLNAQKNANTDRPVSQYIQDVSNLSHVLTQLPSWKDNIRGEDLSVLYTTSLPKPARRELQQWSDRYILAKKRHTRDVPQSGIEEIRKGCIMVSHGLCRQFGLTMDRTTAWLSHLDAWQWIHLCLASILLVLVYQVHQAREFWRGANASQANEIVLGWRETGWESDVLRDLRWHVQVVMEQRFMSKRHSRMT